MDRTSLKRSQVLGVLREWNALGGRAGLTVGQIMTASPSCIRPSLPLADLIRLFHDRGFRHFLVTDEEANLRGLVSDRDVLRWLGPGADTDQLLAETTADQVMSTDLITVEPETRLVTAIELMVRHGINSLPVLAEGKLVGILTNTDLDLLLIAVLEAWFDQAHRPRELALSNSADALAN